MVKIQKKSNTEKFRTNEVPFLYKEVQRENVNKLIYPIKMSK
jgi:hypothetical protein